MSLLLLFHQNLGPQNALASSATGVGAAKANLTDNLQAKATGVGSVSVSASVQRLMVANATGVGRVSAGMALTHWLTGSPVGIGAGLGGLSLSKPLTASLVGVGRASGFLGKALISNPFGVGKATGSLTLTVYPADPKTVNGAEVGDSWSGSAVLNPATTGYGGNFVVSAQPSSLIGYAISGVVVTGAYLGFVAASNPQTQQPTVWYPAGIEQLAPSLYVALLPLGASAGFQPAAGTLWWVWVDIGTGSPFNPLDAWGVFIWGTQSWGGASLIQAGQLFVV